MPRKKKPTLLKGSIIAGILLGIAYKAWEFYSTRKLWCGVIFPIDCDMSIWNYIRDLGITIFVTTISTLILVYGGIYIIRYILSAIKHTKMSDLKKTFKTSSPKKESAKKKEPKKVIDDIKEAKEDIDEVIRI